MAKPGFWNDNRFRAYPFLRGEVGVSGSGAIANVPNDVIVDAGFTMGLESGYVEGEHSVWLSSVTRSGTTLTFVFESDAPGLFNRPLTFTRNINGGEYQLEYQDAIAEVYDSESDSLFDAGLVDDELFLSLTDGEWLLVTGSWYVTGDGSDISASFSYDGDDECDADPLWSGFLVTGRFDDFTIADASSWTGDVAVVEPATIVSLVNSYVSTVNVGNADRTRVDAAEGCPEMSWAYPVGEDVVHIQQTCLTGGIRFKAGYNAEIEQDNAQNQIIIGADVGAGEGVPCDEIPLFPAETPPEGSTLYEGGPRCNEVLRSINGMGGQLLRILSGTGVNITEVPAQNKLIMDFDMRGLAVCYDDVSDVSESV